MSPTNLLPLQPICQFCLTHSIILLLSDSYTFYWFLGWELATQISVVAASVLSRTVRVVVTTDVDKLIPTDVSSLTRKALSKGAALSESILRVIFLFFPWNRYCAMIWYTAATTATASLHRSPSLFLSLPAFHLFFFTSSLQIDPRCQPRPFQKPEERNC